MTSWPAGLYVVATPIGNLDELTPRAAEALRRASVVAAEDTRVTATLLRRAGSAAPALSLTEHNVMARAPQLLEAARDHVVVLVSDAGTPAVADPGARLVASAHAAGIPVRAVAGPSALAAALSVAGFDAAVVAFAGFLPRPKGERLARLRAAGNGDVALVFFESPRRLAATLAELAEAFDDPETVVCRELTKLHEEVVRGRASALAERFHEVRGECTVVVRLTRPHSPAASAADTLLAAMKRAGARRAAAAGEVARITGAPRDALYARWDEV